MKRAPRGTFPTSAAGTDTSSVVVRGTNGGTQPVKEPGSSKVWEVFDPLAKSTVRMFGSSVAQSAVGEPDFGQFDVRAIGRTGVPLPPSLRVTRPDGALDE